MAIVLENLIDLGGLNRFLVRSKEIFKEKLKYTVIPDEYITWSILPGQVYKIFLTCPDKYEHEINCSEEIVLGSTYNVDCDFVEMRAIKAFGNAKTANPWIYYTADETGAVVYLRNPFYLADDPGYSECCICVVDMQSDTIIDDVEGYSGDLSNYPKCVIESVSGPIMSKTWTYTCASTAEGDARIALFNVIPTSDNFNDPWYIRYHLKVSTTQANCQFEADCYLSQAGVNLPYSNFNTLPSAQYAIYNQEIYWHNTAAMYANRKTYPAKVGVRVQSGAAVNTLARTYTIEIIDFKGCDIEFLSAPQKQSSFYSTTNYARSELNAAANGLQESGDTDTQVAYALRDIYTGYVAHSAETPLFKYKICGFDQETRLVPISINDPGASTTTTDLTHIPCNVPMVVSKGLVYYNSTTNIFNYNSRSAGYTIYRYNGGGSWKDYNFPISPILYQDIYLKGFYNPVTDEFTLDTTDSHSYYTFVRHEYGYCGENRGPYIVPEGFEKGYFYWYVGYQTGTQAHAVFTTEHPLFYFDGERLVPATPNGKYEESKQVDVTFNSRKAPVNVPSVVTVTSVKGNNIVWNQLAKNPDFSNGTTDWSVGSGGGSISVNAEGHLVLTCPANQTACTIRQPIVTRKRHSYLVKVRFRVNSTSSNKILARPGYFGTTSTVWTGGEYYYPRNEWINLDLTVVSPSYDNAYIYFGMYHASTAWSVAGDTIEFEYINVIDLTRMFGWMNEPSVDDFKNLYPKDYYRYYDSGSNGIASTVTGSTDTNISVKTQNHTSTRQILSSWTLFNSGSGRTYFKNICPRGLLSTGRYYDEVTETELIQRIAPVRLKDLTWGKYDNNGIYSCSNWSGSIPFDIDSRAKRQIIFSSKYPCSSSAETNDTIYVGSTGILYIKDTDYKNNLAAFTKSLADDDVWLYYKRATDVTYSKAFSGLTSYSISPSDIESNSHNFWDEGSYYAPTVAPLRLSFSYKKGGNAGIADMSAPPGSDKFIENKVGGYRIPISTDSYSLEISGTSLGIWDAGEDEKDVSLEEFRGYSSFTEGDIEAILHDARRHTLELSTDEGTIYMSYSPEDYGENVLHFYRSDSEDSWDLPYADFSLDYRLVEWNDDDQSYYYIMQLPSNYVVPIYVDGVAAMSSGGSVVRTFRCTTSATAVTKSVTAYSGRPIDSYMCRVTVDFVNKNTADSPYLNVQGTSIAGSSVSVKGDIYYNNVKITTGSCKEYLYGQVDLLYSGSRWNIVGTPAAAFEDTVGNLETLLAAI